MDYNRGVVARSFLWKLLERFSVQGLSLVITFVLARILDPSDYGTVALIIVFTSLSSVIIDGGLNTALIQKKDADNIDFSTIFFSSLLLSFVIYAILYFSAPLISAFYNTSTLTPVVRVLSVIIIFEAMNAVQRAYVAKNMLFKKLFYSTLAALVLSGTVGLIMAIKGYGVWALVCQQVCSNVVTMLVMFFTIRWMPSMTFSFNRFKTLFNYGWKIFGINLMVEFYQNIRNLIIGKYYSPASLAFFERGRVLPQLLVSNVSTSLQTVIFPVFSDAQNDSQKVKEMVRKAVSLSCFSIFPTMVLLIVVAKPLILLLLTEKWLPAVPFVWIFASAYMVFFVQVASMEAVKAMGFSGFSLKYEIVKHVIETVILLVSVFWGVYAIAVGTIVYNTISFILNIYPNLKFLHYGIREQMADILPTLLSAILAGVTVFWFQLILLHPLLLILMQSVCGGVVFLLLCQLFRIKGYLYVKTIAVDKFMKRYGTNKII